MKFALTIHGQEHTLELTLNNGLACSLDGIPFPAEIAEVQPGVYSLLIGGQSFAAHVDSTSSPQVAPSSQNNARDTGNYMVQMDGVSYAVTVRDPRRRPRDRTQLAIEGRQTVKAPMPGKVIRVLVSEGQAVNAGQGLIVVEAMKMQNEIKCPKAGTVQKILARAGQAVNAGETLLVVD